MAAVEITWNLGVWGVSGEGPVGKALARAVKKAGGDAARAMRTESSRGVREKKRFKAGRVKKALPLAFPHGTAIDALVWRMDVSGAATPLGDLTPRQTQRGVTFGINRGKRSLIKGAFIATMRSGHSGVFFRHGKARLPIDEAFTTKVSDVFKDGGFIPDVYARTQAVFGKAFDRLFPIELARMNRR